METELTINERKVLVTGSSGLIGSHLVRRLLQEGYRVRATVHKKRGPIADSRIEFVECDLTQASDCKRAVADIDMVFHCAASTSGAAAIASTPMIHVTPNVIMNTLMLDAAYAADVKKFIWLGSTVAYPMSDRPVKEEEMFNGPPFEKYFFAGWTKRFTELLCQMYGEKLVKRMTTIVLRPTNVYGPDDDFEFATSHVIPALIRKVVERWDPLEVWGDGSEVRDAVYVDDMVDAMILASNSLQGHHAINIGLGRGYNVKELLEMIQTIDGYLSPRIVFNADRPTMIPLRLVDTSKAEQLLGFKAKVGIEEGLRRTIKWYRESNSLPR